MPHKFFIVKSWVVPYSPWILIKRALNLSGFEVGGLRLPMKDSDELGKDFSQMLSNYDIDVTNI